jgi:2-polyprenyl-6-methoxyphenol hydroxylase-like FAD-dependent oxidoreductase
MTDVLIAGGGIAGSALAILLGRQGLEVELFERGHFPREKPCGEGLMPGGVAVLARLGLDEAAGGAPFYGVRYHFGSQTAEGRFPPAREFPEAGRGQRRRHLDQVLFEAARKTPGVRAHCGVEVEGLLSERGRVVGVAASGEQRRGRLVVGADGVQSRVRRLMGVEAQVARRRFGARAHFRLAEGREQPPWVDVFVSPGHELYVTPLPNREVLVAALAEKGAWGEPFEDVYRRWRDSERTLAERLEGAEQITPLLCTSPLAGGARRGVAPGIVLLGDAAGFLDPITGGGMTQALMTAELLAQYIAERFGGAAGRIGSAGEIGATAATGNGLAKAKRNGSATMSERGSPKAIGGDAWMWEFERQRKRMLADYRLLTRMVLWLADHPGLAERLIGTLRVAPGILSHLIGVSGGMRPLFGFAPGAAVRGKWQHGRAERAG